METTKRRYKEEIATKDTVYNDYIVVGMSTHDLAKKYGCGQSTVRRMLRDYSIEVRGMYEHTDFYHKKVAEYYKRYSVEYRINRTLICAYCNKEFTVNDCDKKRNKYCSKQCISDARNAAKISARTFTCAICGKIAVSPHSGKRKYCDECYPIWKSTNQNKIRVEVNCGYCGKALWVIKSRANKRKNLYCDVKCMAEHYKVTNSGVNSATWKGGKPDHYYGGWADARRDVRQRDDYVCQICGKHEDDYGQELSVHHIKEYRKFADPYEANQIDNLVCLCEPCHRFVHSRENTERAFRKA